MLGQSVDLDRGRLGRRVGQGIAGLGLAMLLSGCGQPPVPFANYCTSQKRTVRDRERIVAALTFVSTPDYDRRLRHFAAFRKRAGAGSGASSGRRIAEQYLARYPDCCTVARPWVVEEYRGASDWLGRNDAFHAFYRANANFRWSNDVVIVATPSKGGTSRKLVRIQSSDCGAANDIGRG